MSPRLRADYRVLNLGEVVCVVAPDLTFRSKWVNGNVYSLALPVVQRALERNGGTRWEKLIRERCGATLSRSGP